MATATIGRVHELERKIDALGEQVAFLVKEARIQAQRRERWEELSSDAMPLATTAMERVCTELDEVGFDTEALVALLRRLAANVETLERLLIGLESGLELVDDAQFLATEAMATATRRLDELDRKGYFTFLQAGLGVVDRVVTNFTEEDVNQLGDNVVLILETIKELTQPEIMAVLYRMIEAVERQRLAFEAEPEEPPSLWQLTRTVREPDVRRGLGRALATLRAVSQVDPRAPQGREENQRITQGGD